MNLILTKEIPSDILDGYRLEFSKHPDALGAISAAVNALAKLTVKEKSTDKVNVYLAKVDKQLICQFELGELKTDQDDAEYAKELTPAEKLCLSTLPMNTCPVKAAKLMKHPFWQEVINEMLAQWVLDV